MELKDRFAATVEKYMHNGPLTEYGISAFVGDLLIDVVADSNEKDAVKNAVEIDQKIAQYENTVTGENGAPIRG